MHKYRISKYDPCNRNRQGYYEKDEWTSCSDIGKKYDGKVFKVSDYIITEEEYCKTILCILKNRGTSNVVIRNLELYCSVDDIRNQLELTGLVLSTEEEAILKTIKNNKKIYIDELKPYIKLILRECIWCILVDSLLHQKIEFGYDFYCYVYCAYIPKAEILKYRNQGIFVEKM